MKKQIYDLALDTLAWLVQDELLWETTWIHEATGDQYYLNYMIDNAGSLGGTTMAMNEFSWDDKYAGVQVLASKVRLRYQ